MVEVLAGPGAEAGLMARAKRGDLAAFNRLVLAHQACIYSMACALLGDREAATAAVADGIGAAFRRRGSVPATARCWLAASVLGECRRRSSEIRAGNGVGLPQAVRALPWRERCLLVLVDVCGFTYQEAAQAMAMETAGVRAGLGRARAAVARQLPARSVAAAG